MTRFLRTVILLFLIAIAGWPDMIAQPAGKPLVINYNRFTYGGDNQSWSMAANKRGMVYAGNDKGLLEFDGSNWQLYTMPENAVVRSVAVDGDSRVYVGSYEEFGYWEPGAMGILKYHSLSREHLGSDDLHNDEIWRIIPYHGKIYFQSFSTIFIYDGAGVKILKPEASVVLLMLARDRMFIHMVGRGLYELVDDNLQWIPGSDLLANDEVKIILPYGDSDFLVGASAHGLYLFDGTSFSPWGMPINDKIRPAGINNGIQAGDLLVIGTIAEGIFIMDAEGNLLEHISTSNFLQNNTVLSLCSDNRNNLWAGLDMGIDFINLHAGLDFYVDPSGTMGSVYAAVKEGTSLLVGTNHGLYRYTFKPGTGYIDPTQLESISSQVWDLGVLGQQIYCGYNEGTSIIRGNESIPVTDINGGFTLKSIPGTGDRYQLQSTYSSLVVYEKSDRQWTYLHAVEGFLEPVVQFEFDHLGNIWALHITRGIFRIRLNEELDSVQSVSYYGRNKGLPFERGLALAKIENRIVFPTGKSLYTWDDLNDTIVPFTQLNTQSGVFSDASQIITAREHFYWFIKDQQVAYFHIDGNTFEEVFQYDLSLQGMYLGTRYRKIVPLDDSTHLICLDNGFALFHETDPITGPEAMEVQIRRMTASNASGRITPYSSAPQARQIRIRYPYRNISLLFASNQGYKYPTYRHRLDGLEEQWSAWHMSSSIDYKRLPSGEYTFMVEAKNIQGFPGPVQSLSFFIRPPWYASLMAAVLYVILFILAAILVRSSFLRRLRLHKMKYEKEEKENREKQILLAEQELIRLKNEKLQSEIQYKSAQLADYTMNIIRKNEELIKIREKLVEQRGDIANSEQRTRFDQIIQMIDNQISSEDDWHIFEIHFDKTYQDFIKRLKTAFPDLTQSDLKLCAFLRLNLSSKEIAPLLNITIRGIEIRRYRLRKRLKIKTEENLVDFLLRF